MKGDAVILSKSIFTLLGRTWAKYHQTSKQKPPAGHAWFCCWSLQLSLYLKDWQTHSYTVTVSIASGFVSIGFQIDRDNSAKLKPSMAKGFQSSLWATSEPYNTLRFLSSLNPHTDQLGHIRLLGTWWADEKTRIIIWSPPPSLLFYLPECFSPLHYETKHPVCLKFS